jgi:hypothetical protein
LTAATVAAVGIALFLTAAYAHIRITGINATSTRRGDRVGFGRNNTQNLALTAGRSVYVTRCKTTSYGDTPPPPQIFYPKTNCLSGLGGFYAP